MVAQGKPDAGLLSAPAVQAISAPLPPNQHVNDFLRDGASEVMAVNGSGTAVVFKWTCPSGFTFEWHRVAVVILDAGVGPNIFAGQAALTNGLLFKVYNSDDSVDHDILNGVPIKKNAHFNRLAGRDTDRDDVPTVDALSVRWTVKNNGRPMHLNPGQYIGVTVQDNLMMDEFTINVHGILHHE